MGRTFASVTDEDCKCGSLERDANDPDSPIIFDVELNEYQFEYTVGDKGKAKMTIYHCPFCGGAAPESHRENLFAVIPNEEEARLRELTARILP